MSSTPGFLLSAAFSFAELGPIGLVVGLGCASIYLLLPRPKRLPTLWGVSLGTLAVILAGILVANTGSLSVESLLFYAFSIMAVVAGTLLVTQHNPARAALSFTLVILSTCGLFLLLAAPFLMAATIIVYAGAIVVTFLFVLMLAQQSGPSDADDRSREPLFSALAGFAFLGALLFVLQGQYGTSALDSALDPVVKRIRLAREQNSVKEIMEVVGKEEDGLFKQLDKVLADHRQEVVRAQVLDQVRSEWPSTNDDAEKKMKTLLDRLLALVYQARIHVGVNQSQPHGDFPEKMSSLSGPSALTSGREIRRDPETGVPQLPAENAAYLGRSLFTDYLLPVELGGFLLLVAVVGAIAIAQRSGSQEKSS
jgi:NADH-quinone oxidoreductase subunit J